MELRVFGKRRRKKKPRFCTETELDLEIRRLLILDDPDLTDEEKKDLIAKMPKKTE